MKPTLWHIPHGDRLSSFTSRRPGPIVGLPGVARSWWSACSEDYGGTSGRYPRGRLKCLDGRRGSAGFLSRGRHPVGLARELTLMKELWVDANGIACNTAIRG